MLQFKKAIYLGILPYGKKQMRSLFLIFCSSCLPRYNVLALFLILFSFAAYIDSNIVYAAEEESDGAEEPGDRLAGRKRGRSPGPLSAPTTTAPALSAVPASLAAEVPGEAAESTRATVPPASAVVASGDEPEPKRGRASGPSTLAVPAPPPPIVLNPQIAGMFDLRGLDAEPIKRDLITHCLVEISGNGVGVLLLRILGEQLGQYHRRMQAYSGAIAQLKPHATAAFFAHLNGKIAEIPEAAEDAAPARGGAAARVGAAAGRGAVAGGRASRKPTAQIRIQAKVAALKKLVGYEEEPAVEAAFAHFLASPVVVSIMSADETCFNYTGPIPLFLLPGNLRIGNLCINLDFKKIHFLGRQPSSLTTCLGGMEGDKVAVGMHYAPYYLTIAHELTHTKHFLESINIDIEHATQNVQRIYAACTAKACLAVELHDVFPDERREVQGVVPLENMSYLRALKITDYDSRTTADRDFRLLTREDELHEQFLTEDDRRLGRKYPFLWNNLEERRTVVGPDKDGISELTLRLSAGISMRYLYQDMDRHLFEDPEIIRNILERNSEQVSIIFGRPITLEQLLEVSGRNAEAFIFKRFYALA